MTSNDKAKVLVTGATGMQGGAVVQALLRAGHPVTALVRNPSSAPRPGARPAGRPGNRNHGRHRSPSTLPALDDAVFSMQPVGLDPADPGAERRQASNIATAAKRAGVTQIIHTSVSATGWRSEHPNYELSDLTKEYWDQKEASRGRDPAGGHRPLDHLQASLLHEQLPLGQRDPMFPDPPQGKLVTATSPQTVLALINADDFGAAVAAAVAEPDKFHEAEIELAGDAVTHTDIADTLSKAAGREITAVFASREEQEQRIGAPMTDSQIWNDRVGYPARPHHAAHYGLTTTTLEQWAARQDWTIPTALNSSNPAASPAERCPGGAPRRRGHNLPRDGDHVRTSAAC